MNNALERGKKSVVPNQTQSPTQFGGLQIQNPPNINLSNPTTPTPTTPVSTPGVATTAFQGGAPLSAELAKTFRESLGPAPTVNYNPITPEVSKLTPTRITGLPDQYFQSQKDQLKEQLREEFFGRGGNWDTAVESESAAGRLGSGVARQMLQKTVTEPFIKASTTIDQNILQSVLAERARVEGYNADQVTKYNELLSRAAEVDSSNRLTAEKASADLITQYNDLASRLADAEAGRLSQEGIAQLEGNIRIFQSVLEDRRKADALAIEQEKNRQEDYRKQQELQIEFLRTPISPSKQTEGQQGVGRELAGTFGYATNTPPVAAKPRTAGSSNGQLSPDGKWRWNSRIRDWYPV